jgi:hypothetical protein
VRDTRIPTEQFVGILMEAERRRQDPLIGMHAGERCEPRGPVAYLLTSHGSLADGLRAMTRVAALTVERIRIDLDIGFDTASVLFHPRDPTFECSLHARSSAVWAGAPARLSSETDVAELPSMPRSAARVDRITG